MSNSNRTDSRSCATCFAIRAQPPKGILPHFLPSKELGSCLGEFQAQLQADAMHHHTHIMIGQQQLFLWDCGGTTGIPKPCR